MKKLLFALLLLCSIPALSQIQTNVIKQCYLLYDFDGKAFNKNKKIKEGTSITLTKESDYLVGFYMFYIKGKNTQLKKTALILKI